MVPLTAERIIFLRQQWHNVGLRIKHRSDGVPIMDDHGIWLFQMFRNHGVFTYVIHIDIFQDM